MATSELTVSEVVRLGGWDAAFAVVPTISTAGDVAVALVAGNGLTHEAEVEVFRRDGDNWRSTFSFGFGNAASGATSGAEAGCVFAVGRASDRSGPVFVAFGNDVFEVQPGPEGYWSWIKTVDEPWSGGNPEVVEST